MHLLDLQVGHTSNAAVDMWSLYNECYSSSAGRIFDVAEHLAQMYWDDCILHAHEHGTCLHLFRQYDTLSKSMLGMESLFDYMTYYSRYATFVNENSMNM